MEPNLIKETPEALAFIICDQIITDAPTNKKTLVGIFSRINAEKFPAAHPSMVVFMALSGAKGVYDAKLRMTLEGAANPIFELKGKIQFTDPMHVVEMSFVLRQVKFDRAGIYNFEFYCDDDLIQTRRFEVADKQKP